MSFSKQVKAEICMSKAKKSIEQEAQLYGLMLPWLNDKSKDVILIKSESEAAIFELFELIEGLTEQVLEVKKMVSSTKLSVQMNFEMLPFFIKRAIKDDLKVKLINDYCSSERLRIFFTRSIFKLWKIF